MGPNLARFGRCAISDLSPLCGLEQTSSERCSWIGFLIARHSAPLVLAADRLQEHRVPVEIKELLLAAGERAHIDGLCGVNTHPLK